ncbi:MAG: host attachment protein [Deltaproteobacteria bacterium]|nr:MAG: host attachment protein [Deltaproteobacteria bacterium]
MSDYCVVVTGGAHARFFTLEPVEFPELESGPKLIDRGELLNPVKEIAGRDLYTDLKTGRSRAPHGGPSHGYDDHRTQHEDEFDRRFARKVVEVARRLAKENRARRIVLAAPARMLGLLRQDLDVIHRHGIEVHKVAKDMSKFSPRQIHDHLAKRQLLPACRRPGIC